jgi:hypothetical protein
MAQWREKSVDSRAAKASCAPHCCWWSSSTPCYCS